MQQKSGPEKVISVVLKGYPRLSETFIAQELRALEKRGYKLQLISLRHPTDPYTHPIHDEIEAPVNYLPEYLYQEPLRVLKSWWKVRKYSGYRKSRKIWWQDLMRDKTSNRIRRFGQALVFAAEIPENTSQIYAHFLHTPASVARYASMITDVGWSCSAHAKDIYTSPDWEISEKLGDLDWLVTCTSFNTDHLKSLAAEPPKVELMYHGLDLSRFDSPKSKTHSKNGLNPDDPVQILSVGRAVEKKGYDDLLNALSKLPESLSWQFIHIGGGPLLKDLKRQAEELGIHQKILWKGALSQKEVRASMTSADIFVLASRIAEDGDRDGLPNVLMEAQSQRAAIVSTKVSAIPELIESGVTGLLVEQRRADEIAEALEIMISDPEKREKYSRAGEARLRENFDLNGWIDRLAEKFKA